MIYEMIYDMIYDNTIQYTEYFAHSSEIFSTLEDKILISARPCNILYILGHTIFSSQRVIITFLFIIMVNMRQTTETYAYFYNNVHKRSRNTKTAWIKIQTNHVS